MKKKYIFSIAFTAMFLLGITGCKKSFLNVEPSKVLRQKQIDEAAKNNPEVLVGTMRGIYSLMFQTGTGGTTGDDDFGQKGYDIYSDFLSGDLELSASIYGWYRTLCELNATTDYTRNENYMPWRYYYRIIRSANNVIASIGGNDSVPATKERQYIMGQAKAIRAYAYFYLTQFYSESAYDPTAKILPIYTEPTRENQPKSTAQDVFNLMVKDLTQADSLLDGFQRTSLTQINKSVSEGLLAYVYATMGGTANWTKAEQLTNDIIQNGGFTLEDSTQVVYTGNSKIGGFNNVNNNPGWMWGVDLTSDNGLNLVSWWGQMDFFTYSYAWAGDTKVCDASLYSKIPADDVRKNQFYTPNNWSLLLPQYGGYVSDLALMPVGKFYPTVREAGTQRDITTDYVYMRVAEMYLLNAECAAHLSDDGQARTSLKALMRERVPDVSYIDNLSGQALLNEIYLQTRIELWGEGKSYLAMKRFKAATVRGSNNIFGFDGVPIEYNDPRLTFSIPQAEILNNPFISSGNKNN